MLTQPLALEFGAGLLALICFGISVASRLTNQEQDLHDDGLRGEKRDAVSEALSVLGFEQPTRSGRLIVHNGLSASRRQPGVFRRHDRLSPGTCRASANRARATVGRAAG